MAKATCAICCESEAMSVSLKHAQKTTRINQNILKEFLQTREREVEEMSMLLYTQEQLFDIALAEKFNDGLEQGLEQGLERGLEQGRREREYKIAKDMKQSAIPLPLIVKCTGLTEEEVANL